MTSLAFVASAGFVTLSLATIPGRPTRRITSSEIAAGARSRRTSSCSRTAEPVPAELKPKLLPLEYFPIDAAYSVPAGLKTLEKFEPVDLVTSTGSIDKYERVGTSSSRSAASR